MKTKTRLLIAGLVVLSAMVVFTGTAYADTVILRPNGVGNETGINRAIGCNTHHWQCVVDEAPDDDDDSTFVYQDQGSGRDLYALSDPIDSGTIEAVQQFKISQKRKVDSALNPKRSEILGAKNNCGTATINKVTAYIRIATATFRIAKMTYSDSVAKGAVSINTYDITYDGTEINCLNSWTTYSKEWITNPYTGEAWTWDEIKALEAGVKLTPGSNPPSRCTQVYVEVDYTPDQTNPIPEFSTIAIPVASILGLLFFFSYRKRRRNE